MMNPYIALQIADRSSGEIREVSIFETVQQVYGALIEFERRNALNQHTDARDRQLFAEERLTEWFAAKLVTSRGTASNTDVIK